MGQKVPLREQKRECGHALSLRLTHGLHRWVHSTLRSSLILSIQSWPNALDFPRFLHCLRCSVIKCLSRRLLGLLRYWMSKFLPSAWWEERKQEEQ